MRYIFLAITVITLAGCVPVSTSRVAQKNGFTQAYVQTEKFRLATYKKINKPGKDINIYIEGDGRAWITRSMLSTDPSPRTSTVMQLAALDPNPNVVYLARPCQYSPGDLKTVCHAKYWSAARYSPTVVQSINDAITQIKNYAKAKKVNLIGYSGGGTLAVLVAAKRTDIASIRTIAGNLDLTTMDKIHNTTPLRESIDPLSVAMKVKDIPQIHFCGAKDKIVPPVVAKNFAKVAKLKPKSVVIIEEAGHRKNWAQNWPALLKYVP